MADTTLRYLETLRAIPRHPRRTTVAQVHQHLHAAGYAINKRSVERDLHKLSARFPIVCDEDAKPAGWCWQADAADLIAPGLTTGEALELELIARYLKPLLPAGAWTALQPRLSAARHTLNTLSDAPLARWRKRVAVIADGPPLQWPEVSPDVLACVHESLLRERCLTADYHAVGSRKARSFTIHPVALVYQGQVGYLVATLWDYQDLRHLALHRMRQAVLTDEPARRPPDFELDRYLREESAFDFPGQERFVLKLRVDGWLARFLEERPLAADQKIQATGDEAIFTVRATVRQSERLFWWLRSQGPAVEVLAPKDMRERMATEMVALAARYTPSPA